MTSTSSARELMEAALRAHQAGQLSQAADLYRRFLALRPGQPDALSNLGNALLQLGRLEEAVDACRAALVARPNHAEAALNLGMALQRQGQVAEAIAAYRQVVQIRPDFPEGLNCLATALQQNGQLADAIAAYRQAIALRPGYRDALNNLGNTLRESGQFEAAIDAFHQGLAHQPHDAELLNNLGIGLEILADYAKAERAYRAALAERPAFPQAHYNLANVLQKQEKMDEAIAAFRSAIAIDPNLAEAWINLGNALRDTGDLQEALRHYRHGVAIRPDSRMAGTLLYGLHFDPTMSARQLYDEHVNWNRQYAQPLAHLIRPHVNDRSPDRRLRIGYVSPDLGNHPVGRFMLPLLSHHDHSQFEIFCYSDTARFDTTSRANQAQVDVWRTTVRLPDEQVTHQIRDDRIDILVDLTMHSSENRLLVFARKPAPVQVTYLAYPGTTGLETIDYRLTDPYLDPIGAPTEACFSEETYRLPHTFWCYAAPAEACDVGPVPASSNGYLTFGCLNSFSKVSDLIFGAWITILREIPHSRLLVYCRQGSHRQWTRDRLAGAGVDPARLDFVGFQPTADYFREYRRIDLALDTFPYAGGTTTCDTLWMGVPVVTLAGQTPISRGGASILSNVGLAELITQNVDQYVQTAKRLAADVTRLKHLRETMRTRVLASPLINAATFARDVEAAYRQMWRRWCASPK